MCFCCHKIVLRDCYMLTEIKKNNNKVSMRTLTCIKLNLYTTSKITPSEGVGVCYLSWSGQTPLNSCVSQLQLLLSFCIPLSLTHIYTV